MTRSERRRAIAAHDAMAHELRRGIESKNPTADVRTSIATSALFYATLANGLRLDEIIDELAAAGQDTP